MLEAGRISSPRASVGSREAARRASAAGSREEPRRVGGGVWGGGEACDGGGIWGGSVSMTGSMEAARRRRDLGRQRGARAVASATARERDATGCAKEKESGGSTRQREARPHEARWGIQIGEGCVRVFCGVLVWPCGSVARGVGTWDVRLGVGLRKCGLTGWRVGGYGFDTSRPASARPDGSGCLPISRPVDFFLGQTLPI